MRLSLSAAADGAGRMLGGAEGWRAGCSAVPRGGGPDARRRSGTARRMLGGA
ncbi:hypothetical protein [Subtercola sp. YIM 133946]|uniref:hypothetical protein n=1 Tax=Subtercola sp. YIM 133946 TaxID=3118909 RepID=UPI002F9287CA